MSSGNDFAFPLILVPQCLYIWIHRAELGNVPREIAFKDFQPQNQASAGFSVLDHLIIVKAKVKFHGLLIKWMK
jgi:hypothetical protein